MAVDARRHSQALDAMPAYRRLRARSAVARAMGRAVHKGLGRQSDTRRAPGEVHDVVAPRVTWGEGAAGRAPRALSAGRVEQLERAALGAQHERAQDYRAVRVRDFVAPGRLVQTA